MSGYVEVMIRGDCRAFLDASAVAGVITSKGCSGDTPGTADSPLSLIMRGGDILEGVYGVSPNRLLVHLAGVKLLLREQGRFCVVAYMDDIENFESQINDLIARRSNG